MRSGGKAGIKSFAKTALRAVAFSTLAFSAHNAAAQQMAAADTTTTDAPVTVTGQRQGVESPKYVAPLVDTPQTITVVPHAVIEQQSLLSLRDVLSTLPGITFGAGEGGGGFGDSINLRGFSANNDIQVDGVRDSAQYSRSDPFNLEQVEVINGANSVYAGAGSVGGSINLVTKRPTASNNTLLSGALGADQYQRATLDMNRTLGDDVAVRLNAMRHTNDAPGRDVENFDRWGVAPSITFGLDGPTQFTALYVHQEDTNTPQYGVPFALNGFNSGPLPGTSSKAYYGYRNLDVQESKVDSLTFILEHEFNEALSIRNLTRWEHVDQHLITDAPQGTFCLANGTNPYNLNVGHACAGSNTIPDTVLFTATGPRGNLRDSENTELVNQTDLTARFNTGFVKHTLVAGVSFSSETYSLTNGNVERTELGAQVTLPRMSITNPDSFYTGPVNFIQGGGVLANGPTGTCVTSSPFTNCIAPAGATDSEVNNRAIYAFERAQLSPQWELNAGIRFEHNEGSATTTYYTPLNFLPSGNGSALGANSPGAPAGVVNGASLPAKNDDDLLSYRFGVVFKPLENASLYAAYGNSKTPSQSTVNGGCTVLGGTTGASNCNLKPESARNYEIGAKYDTFGGRLSLTASVFRNERTNFRVNSGDPSIPEQQLDGESRVDGATLGVAGLLTRHWSIFANYSYLDSEVLQSISDHSLLSTIDISAGDPLPNTPKNSFSFWTTYEPVHGLTLGYGATYQGEMTFTRFAVTPAQPLFYTDPYWVHRAMIGYEFTEKFSLQLNVNNLFDELYYTRIRNNATNGWATPGDARNVLLTANLRF